VIGNGERVAILPIGEHELALVVGAPELVGVRRPRERGPLRPMTPLPPAHQAMSIQHRMDCADGGTLHWRVLTP
jgi:hypothetical protein